MDEKVALQIEQGGNVDRELNLVQVKGRPRSKSWCDVLLAAILALGLASLAVLLWPMQRSPPFDATTQETAPTLPFNQSWANGSLHSRQVIPKKPAYQYLQTVFYQTSAGDPYGEPSVYQVDTGPGSIMKKPIPFLSGERPVVNTLDGTAALTRTRITRTRVSKLPFTAGVVTGTDVPAPPPPSNWNSCTDGCQAGYGRCYTLTVRTTTTSPTPTTTFVPPPPPPPVPASSGPGVIGYFPNWGPSITNYDLSGINVINYAFVSMNSDGSLRGGGDYNSGGMMYQLNYVYKQRYPGLRTVFSVGGWTDSQWFSLTAGDPTRRARFADSVYNFMQNNRFDGVDLDWEYPTGGGQDGNTASWNDPQNYVLMVQAIRSRIGSGKLITIAAPTDLSKFGNYLIPLVNALDWVNVMTYDYAGPWGGSAGVNSPLFKDNAGTSDSQSDTMNRYVNAGVPRAKLTMGLGFYGRGTYVASGANDGLYQRQTGAPSGDGTDDPGVWTWRGLRSSILAAGPYSTSGDWRRTYRNELQSPTLYSPSRRVFIGYDDPRSICYKTLWAKYRGFGGVMVWDLSMDNNRELAAPMTEAWAGRRLNCDTN